MKIVLQLKNGCLQTEASRMYERLIQAYLNKSATDESRRMIETQMIPLNYFLEHADFQALRHLNPQLSGIEALSVVLHFFDNSGACAGKEENSRNSDEEKRYFDGDESRKGHPALFIVAKGKWIEPIWKKRR